MMVMLATCLYIKNGWSLYMTVAGIPNAPASCTDNALGLRRSSRVSGMTAGNCSHNEKRRLMLVCGVGPRAGEACRPRSRWLLALSSVRRLVRAQ